MPPPPAIAADESARQRAVDRYRIVDTLPEATYDDVVRVASTLCDTPVALVSLIDRDRQWFKARLGMGASETQREVAVCDHAIREPGRLMEIPDLRQDPRFAAFPAVAGDFAARFYAGVPLVTPQGAPVGTVCVIDREPRTLSDEQRHALAALGRITVALMESGQRAHAHATAQALHAPRAGAPQPPAPGRPRTVAILELQDYARVVERLGERATEKALQALDGSFEQCLRAGGDTLDRVTGSPEFIAVLDEAGSDAVLDCLRTTAARQQRESGLDLRIGAARTQAPGERLEQVYLRADAALSQAKDARR